MTEFWESSFRDKQVMWGWEPTPSAIMALELFKKHDLNNILIPGFGYGRNGKIFIDNGLNVTGIEISQTAIDLAKTHFGESLNIHHGSVNDMPFDQEHFDGIFCYALIHLLNQEERENLIKNCYNQLIANGYMLFVAISKKDARYGQGKEIGIDTFQSPIGVTFFFYDADSVEKEFGKFGLVEAEEIVEPENVLANKPSLRFWKILCKKK
ncbi:MAG: class I SAM-dependent methyltransferase [Bacteroidales bacterium]|nr:class I SAM-dependent methyltransferase [Bacteroidales bacterium]